MCYSPRSLWLALAMDASSRWREGGFWDACGIPLQLYLATGMASVLLPSMVALPQYEEPLSLSYAAALFGLGNSGVLDAGRNEAEEVASRLATR